MRNCNSISLAACASVVVGFLLSAGVMRAATVGSSGIISSSPSSPVPVGSDPMYTFLYTDIAGDVGFGTLSAEASGLADDSLLVTGGTLHLITPSDPSSDGTFNLIPEGPNVTLSPSGLFIVDNRIYPADDAGDGVTPYAMISNPSYLTNAGLLFGNAGEEINIYGNGGGNYALYTEVGGGYHIQNGSGGTFTLTPVPSPAAAWGGIALIGLVGVTKLRQRAQVD